MNRQSVLSLLLSTTLAVAAGAQTVPSLLSPLDGAVVPGLATVASQRVSVDVELLGSAPPQLLLDLPEGRSVVARLAELQRRGSGLVWRGVLDEPEGGVTLTLHRGHVVGLITSGGEAWTVRTLPDGGQSIDRIEHHLFPECGTTEASESSDSRSGFQLGDPDPCPSPIDPVDRVDLLGMYTPQARDDAGGVPQIEALIQAAVDASNTAFGNSEMPIRFRLVGTALANRDDSGSLGSDLSWLANDPDVAALRDALLADMVSLIVTSGGGCGIGQLPTFWKAGGNPTRVHQVTVDGCAVGNLTFAHEHGHNMGLEHDPANANPPLSGTYPYRYGHYVDGSYRTIMSYSNQCTMGCTRVTQWSNPEVVFMGEPTGVEDQRDNRRASGFTDGCVTDYRTGSLFVDGFESGDLSAWSSTAP